MCATSCRILLLAVKVDRLEDIELTKIVRSRAGEVGKRERNLVYKIAAGRLTPRTP